MIGIQVVAHASRGINIRGLNSSKIAPTPRKFHARKPLLLSFATLKHFLFVSKWFKDSYKAKKSRETPENFFSTFHTINGILKILKESYMVYTLCNFYIMTYPIFAISGMLAAIKLILFAKCKK
jgi:hypothetical protein